LIILISARMRLKVIIPAAVLASVALAGPQHKPLEKRTEVNVVPSTGPTLSLTQQLSLADTAADRFKMLPDDIQFVFGFSDQSQKNKGGKGGDLIVANRKTFPALVGTGAGMAVGFLGPCGFNTPHVHPRAVELQIVVAGTVVTEMVPENGVFRDGEPSRGRRVITNTLKAFDMQPFYQGSVHAQFNPECEPAVFVAAFNDEDFGAGQVVDELFSISPEVVSAAFGQAIDAEHVAKFKGKIPASIADGVEACLKKCKVSSKL
jgi:Cupin